MLGEPSPLKSGTHKNVLTLQLPPFRNTLKKTLSKTNKDRNMTTSPTLIDFSREQVRQHMQEDAIAGISRHVVEGIMASCEYCSTPLIEPSILRQRRRLSSLPQVQSM